MAWMQWTPHVPVAQRRAKALREMERLRKRGKDIQPITIEGRSIARSFWGRGWCDHLESFSDFENRLPRGRTYVRNGSVCHLDIQPGRVEAIVSGSMLYNVRINIKKLSPATWKSVKRACAGGIGSMLELLQGRLSDQVMAVVTDRRQGLFPQPNEIELHCDCPDWAVMCKHVAATLYGVGSRLDDRPELLFLLRDVDADELISTEMALPRGAATADTLDDGRLGEIFGIDLDDAGEEHAAPASKSRKRGRASKAPLSAATTEESRNDSPPRLAPASEDFDALRGTGRTSTQKKKPSRGARADRAPLDRADVPPPMSQPTGKSVARLRARLGLSAAAFASALGVTAASVYRWEATTGRLKLQSRPLAALARLRQQAGGKSSTRVRR